MVDACVNDHAGVKATSGELALGNLTAMTRNRALKCRGDVVEMVVFLEMLAGSTEPMHKRRAATAKKWALRLRRSAYRTWVMGTGTVQ